MGFRGEGLGVRREGNKEVMRSPRCLGFGVRGKGLGVRILRFGFGGVV